MRTWNKPNSQGNLFSCTLKDQSGSIRATAFKEDADRLYKDLQVGKTYIITQGSIKLTNKTYDHTGHECEITFGRDTTVQEVFGKPAAAGAAAGSTAGFGGFGKPAGAGTAVRR